LRLLLAAFAIAALAPNAALASSFVTVAPPKPGATPSILQIDAPVDPATKIATLIGKLIRLATPLPEGDQSRMVTVSASVVSFDAQPQVTMEKVAAIGKRQNLPEPIVMRGGVTGGAFITPQAAPDVAAVPDKPVQEQAAPGETIPSAVRGGSYGGAGSGTGKKMADKPAPPPPSVPVASSPPAAQPTPQREGPKPQ
jgi:hypothetical protein